jgi:dTDP-L-rhamnose 4-epimerase
LALTGKVLVTGGAGFLGSHTVDLLVEKGYEVTALDGLVPQVHGGRKPEYLNGAARYIFENILELGVEGLGKILSGFDAVVHLAAAVGVGQSMYQIAHYAAANTLGTAIVLESALKAKGSIRKIVVASSMSVYGEGKYLCERCGEFRSPGLRGEENLRRKIWDTLCDTCGSKLEHVPTDEGKPLNPTSVYAYTKRHQEELCLLVGRTYGIPVVALRYFNIYGPRQALGNPYTGVAAIFSNRILNGRSPFIFEDGDQLRDFVYVKDVARANVLALESPSADYVPINVGTGKPTSINQVADALISLYGSGVTRQVSGRHRKGDIRHCYADVERARALLNFEASYDLRRGLGELAPWAREHDWGAADAFDKSLSDLEERTLASSS